MYTCRSTSPLTRGHIDTHENRQEQKYSSVFGSKHRLMAAMLHTTRQDRHFTSHCSHATLDTYNEVWDRHSSGAQFARARSETSNEKNFLIIHMNNNNILEHNKNSIIQGRKHRCKSYKMNHVRNLWTSSEEANLNSCTK